MNCFKKLLNVQRVCKSFQRYTDRNNRFNCEVDEAVIYHYERCTTKSIEGCAVVGVSRITIPEYLDKAIANQLKSPDFVKENSVQFAELLWSRKPDPTKVESIQQLKNVESRLIEEGRIASDTEEYVGRDKKLLNKVSLREVIQWQRFNYDDKLCHSYLHARGQPDYASLIRVLSEIKNKEPNFTPKTVFDFGSGVGTAFWAIDTLWPGECDDLVCVDVSNSMNKMNEAILEECKTNMSVPTTIRYDSYITSSSLVKYDLVVCSRSMLEVNETSERCTIADLLWQKVKDGGFLVVIESGYFPSFKALLECREFLLEFYLRRSKEKIPNIHVFAPCSHESMCPLYDPQNKIPCAFSVKLTRGNYNNLMDSFCYVILKKEPKTVTYHPRILKLMRRGGHSIFLTCTSNGTIQESVITKEKTKLERILFKKLNQGDHMPARVIPSDFVYRKNSKVKIESSRVKEYKRYDFYTSNEDEQDKM